VIHRSNRRPTGLLLATLALVGAAAPSLAQDTARRRGFSIAITSPANQEIVLGKTRITAEVKIDRTENLDRVEFRVGDDVIFVDREPPFECFHDFGEQSRSWIIRAVAYHREGVSISDAIVTRKVSFSAFERVNRVLLWVTATDDKGNLVAELTREQLRVFEDDREQTIVDFYAEDRPITLAILIDTSGSMQGKMEQVHEAAGAFVKTLRPEDRALVIDFDDKVFLIQDVTSDHEALTEAIRSTEPLGATALYDALHASYRKIARIEGRKAIVLLSDGEDTSSQFSYARVLEEARGNNVMIFSIGLGGSTGEGPRRNVLKEFSESTGGRAFFVDEARELAGVYERIAQELRHQYYVTYSTSNEVWDGRWIRIRLDTTVPGRKLRARSGFLAVRAAEPAPPP
jgi:Ca-activated chloride channel family protein